MPFRAQGQSGARGVSGKAGQDSGTRLALGGTQPALGTMGRMLALYESDEGAVVQALAGHRVHVDSSSLI